MSRWAGDLPQLDFQAGGGLNVIVGCVPPLNGRSSHLIEAAKCQMGPPRSNDFFFGAADDTGAADDRPAGRLAKRPAERPAECPAERLAEFLGFWDCN